MCITHFLNITDARLSLNKLLTALNLKEKPDYALVLAWNFFDEIKKNNRDLADKFVSIKDLEN